MGPNFPTYWWTMGRTLVKCLEVRLEKLNKRYFNYFQTFSSFQDLPCLEHHNMRSCRQKTKVFSESVNYLKFGLDGWVMGSVFQDGGHLFLVLNSYKWREKRYIRLFLLLCCLLCLASWSHFVSWHCFFFFFLDKPSYISNGPQTPYVAENGWLRTFDLPGSTSQWLGLKSHEQALSQLNHIPRLTNSSHQPCNQFFNYTNLWGLVC